MNSKILGLILFSNLVFSIEQQVMTQNFSAQAQANAAFGTADSLDMQTYFQNAQVQEERVQAEPKIITQRITAKPKIITERITGEPRVVTEQIIEPTRQRIVIQPTINKTIEQIRPQYQQGQDEVVNQGPVTMDVQYKNQMRTQAVNVPGDVVNNSYIVQPTVKKIKTNVQILPAETVKKTLAPVERDTEVQDNVSVRTYTVPSDQHIVQPYVQPIQQRENVDIKWAQEEDQVIDNTPITKEAIYQQRSRTQQVNVPGNVYYTQKVTQPTINREEVQVQFQQAPTQETTLQPIHEDTQYSNSKEVKRTVVPYTVQEEIPIGVPEPVVYDVPVYQYEYVPVEEPCDPCCCDDKNYATAGISHIINSTEVEVNKDGRKYINGNLQRDGERKRVQKEPTFADAVKHYGKLYGEDTFQGEYAYGIAGSLYDDEEFHPLKAEVEKMHEKVQKWDHYKNKKDDMMMNNNMHYNVYGGDHHAHAEPIFLPQDQAWGSIPAMKGYKNYEHYMAY